MRKNLTVKTIEALRPDPLGRRYDVADAIVPGFGIRVTGTGKKTYILTARFPGSPNPTRRAIAEVGAMELATAREIARSWLEQILAGIDPKAETERKRRESFHKDELFEEVVERFLAQHVRPKLRSAVEIERLYKRDILPAFKGLLFVSVRRGDVARMLDKVEARAPIMADHVLAAMSKLCNWYQAREETYTSPIVRGMRRTKASDHVRDRMLNDEEIRLLWAVTANAGAYGALLRIALLTGQRRSKLAEMTWDQISDDGIWSLKFSPGEKANAKELKLTTMALKVIYAQPRRIDSPYVFAGRGERPLNGHSKCKRLLDAAMAKDAGHKIPNWVVHDLRRTAKSLMARAGVRPDISERVLGHTITGVEGVCDRYNYSPHKAEALEMLAGLVSRIIEPPGSNVHPISSRTALAASG